MGVEKERFSRGLCRVDGSVCAECLDDRGLADLVEEMASDLRCDFCGQESQTEPIAAPVDDVVDFMNECISGEYEDPAERVGWCSGDGGWLGVTPLRTDELLTDELGLELPNDEDGSLLEALCDGLGGVSREWVRKNPYGPAPEDVYNWSWDEFCKVVRHGRRFFFLDHRADDHDGLLSPQELLRRIAQFCASNGLVRAIPAGTQLYRVRKVPPGQTLSTALELGPPPAERSSLPTRMSPAGIPMFYASDDDETALQETLDGAGMYTIARFEVTRETLILDLTDSPRIPSIFAPVSDTAEADPRYELIFLDHFTHEISVAIDRKDRAHVDYVPTQVVAEYFRAFSLDDGRRLDGIKYASAQRPPHTCYALFAGQEQVVPSHEDVQRYEADDRGFMAHSHEAAWLRLVDSVDRNVT